MAAASHQQHHDFFIYHGQHRQTDHELWKRLFVGFDDAAVNVLSDYWVWVGLFFRLVYKEKNWCCGKLFSKCIMFSFKNKVPLDNILKSSDRIYNISALLGLFLALYRPRQNASLMFFPTRLYE